MRLVISRAIRLAAISALACATYFSLRMALADHLFRSGTAAGAGRALGLEPDNAVYALRFGQPERAAALQPRLAEAWIELGLAAERRGQGDQAESFLERAVTMDATYTPVWTLANFYARRGDGARFLAAANSALQIGDPAHYDPVPLFRLAWSIPLYPAAILQTIPPQERIEALYLNFLLATNRPGAARPVAQRLLAHPQLRDWLPMLAYCDRLIADGEAHQAVSLWNTYVGRTALGRPLLEPAAGVSLTNGKFAWEPLAHGFDWRVLPVERVFCIRAGRPGGMRFIFDGHQAERCQMLEQVVPVVADTRYGLQVRYRTDEIPPGAGPRWRIFDAITRQEIPTDAVPLSNPLDADATVRFITPPGTRLARLALVYERVPGTVRIAGTLHIERVTLDFDP